MNSSSTEELKAGHFATGFELHTVICLPGYGSYIIPLNKKFNLASLNNKYSIVNASVVIIELMYFT